jgi:hypothetical protein
MADARHTHRDLAIDCLSRVIFWQCLLLRRLPMLHANGCSNLRSSGNDCLRSSIISMHARTICHPISFMAAIVLRRIAAAPARYDRPRKGECEGRVDVVGGRGCGRHGQDFVQR